ncbi:MAG: hypothetical protein GY826_09995, partial [Fuerstiella sp.]|nr:hypothetical protein [Fuerstiella sp.]
MESTNVIRRTPQPAPPAPEEEQGLLGALGSSALSGIGMLGNFLALPGSMVRDVATFNNPFDQLLSPLSHENRATGREMTTAWGLTSENKETGWVPFEDPAEFIQDAIGFGAELATDPLGWATGWFKGGAAAAKAANLAGDVGQSAGRIGRTLDKVGNVMDKMDPGFHIGRKVENAYGDTIRAAAKPHISRMSAAAKVAKGRFTDWLDKYDAPTITPTELAHDFAILKAKGKKGRSTIAEDSELLTQLTPMQKMVQRAAQGMGADVHYYGSAKGKHYAAGVSITDFSSRIWVSGDMADGGLLNVAGHEALHLLRNTDPKGFRQLVTNIMEKAKDGKGEIAKGTASYGGDIPPGMELEEGIAMMAGLAWEDSNLWRTIANDPNVAPTFRHAFGDVLGKMTKGMTTGETKVINEIIGDFMYGQREVMAAGGDTARRNQKSADMLDDLDFVDQYQSGMGKFTQSSVDPLSRAQQLGQQVDHYARATAKTAIDIKDRLGRSLQAQMNYKVRGKATRQGQQMGRDATEGTESLLQEFYEPLTALADEMVDLGRVDNETWREVRKAIEMDDFKGLPETLQAPAKHLKQTFAKVHKRGIRAGMKR